jgi:hypothetical protein
MSPDRAADPYAIRLRTLAKHNSELVVAEDLANLIDPHNNS